MSSLLICSSFAILVDTNVCIISWNFNGPDLVSFVRLSPAFVTSPRVRVWVRGDVLRVINSILCRRYREAPPANQRLYWDSLAWFICQRDSCVNIIKL